MKCESCKIIAIVLVLISVVLIGAYQFVEPPPPNQVKVATGREGSGYHTFALEYKAVLEKEGIELEVIPTAGSLEVLEKLSTGEVSVGLVQGGTAGSVDKDSFESLGSLFFEPIWVFHRKEVEVEYLTDLKGARIAVGEETSGTRPMALQLLGDNGITEDTNELLSLTSSDAAAQLQQGSLDAAFFIASPQGEIIIELLKDENIELFSFDRHLAYSQRYPYLTQLKAGRGIVDLSLNIPSEYKTLLSTSASMVVNKDIHPDLIYLLLKTIVETHHEGGLFENQGQFPSPELTEFPMNEDAKYYLENGPSWLQKVFPFRIAGLLDRLKLMLIPLVALLLPLLKGTLPLYRWRIRRKIYRWYEELRRIDNAINDLWDVNSIEAEVSNLMKLQHELLEKVNVPVSYMGEFYALRMHTNLILGRLQERAKDISEGKKPRESSTQPSTDGPLVPITEEEMQKSILDVGNKIVNRYSAISAGTGIIPVPGVDIASLAGVQILMLKELFSLYDTPFKEAKARSIISVSVGSLSPWALTSGTASVLLKLVPGAGHLVSLLTQPVFSFAFSYAIGKTMLAHLNKGGSIDDFDAKDEKETLQEYFDEGKEKAKNKSD